MQSAVDIDKDVLVGRPYGGTGILYNRKLSKYVTHVKVKNSRCTALMLKLNNCAVLLVSVYMPNDYGDSDRVFRKLY